MERDMDLVRLLLLRVEATRAPYDEDAPDFIPSRDREGLEDYTPGQVHYHLSLLVDAGFIAGQPLAEGDFLIERMTWQGHEFLDAVRDPKVWKLTKDGAKRAGQWGGGLLWEVAKGYGKEAARGMGLPIP